VVPQNAHDNRLAQLSAANLRVLLGKLVANAPSITSVVPSSVDARRRPLLGRSVTFPVFWNFSISFTIVSCVMFLPCFLLKPTTSLRQLPDPATRMISIC
jgi:hypothetical protein